MESGHDVSHRGELAEVHMIQTENQIPDDPQNVLVRADFFEMLDQIHKGFDAATSANELVNVAIRYTSKEPSAANIAVSTSFVSQCCGQIGSHPQMTSDEFVKLESLGQVWDVAAKSKTFFQAVSAQLTGVATQDNKFLSDVAILIILKEEFPGLPLREAAAALDKFVETEATHHPAPSPG